MLRSNTFISGTLFNAGQNELVRRYQPLKIYLYVTQLPGKSDGRTRLEVLMVVDDQSTYQVNDKKNCVPVYTQEEFELHENFSGTLPYRVKHEGILLYARMASVKSLLAHMMKATYGPQ